MDGWMDEWMDGWMDGWTDERTDGWLDGWVSGWMDLLTVIGLTPVGNSTVHIYTQTIHRTTQLICEECGPCPIFASYTLAFALQVRKKHG